MGYGHGYRKHQLGSRTTVVHWLPVAPVLHALATVICTCGCCLLKRLKGYIFVSTTCKQCPWMRVLLLHMQLPWYSEEVLASIVLCGCQLQQLLICGKATVLRSKPDVVLMACCGMGWEAVLHIHARGNLYQEFCCIFQWVQSLGTAATMLQAEWLFMEATCAAAACCSNNAPDAGMSVSQPAAFKSCV